MFLTVQVLMTKLEFFEPPRAFFIAGFREHARLLQTLRLPSALRSLHGKVHEIEPTHARGLCLLLFKHCLQAASARLLSLFAGCIHGL